MYERNNPFGSGLADTNWHHVAVSQNGSVFSMYVDGALDSTSNTTAWTSHVGTNAYVYMGGISSWAGYYTKGTIDELQIYNGALSPDQIKEESNRRYLLADWEFNESQNTNTVNFVKKYYGTSYDGANSLLLLKFLPSLMTW